MMDAFAKRYHLSLRDTRSLAVLGMACLASQIVTAAGPAEISFAPPQPVFATPGGIQDIVLADLDLDGDLDIVALGATGSGQDGFGLIHVLRNENGTFPATTVQVGPFFRIENFVHHVRVGDVTGDGLPDIAFIGSTTPLHLMINLGAAVFEPPQNTGIALTFGSLVGLLGMGQLNGDNLADAALGLPGTVAFSDGTGGFSAQPFHEDNNPLTLTVLDLTGDGRDDIAFGFRTHVSNGDGTFTITGTVPAAGSFDCVFADFDEDGDDDVACPRFSGVFQHMLSTAQNIGGGHFSTPTNIPIGDCPFYIRSGDINGDHLEDLVVTHAACGDNTDFVSILTGNGMGEFNNSVLLSANSGVALAVGDINGDGPDDLVLASGTFFHGPDGIDVHINQNFAGMGDFDHDDDVDLADYRVFEICFAGEGNPPVAGCPGIVDADFNNDASVGPGDFAILANNFSGPG